MKKVKKKMSMQKRIVFSFLSMFVLFVAGIGGSTFMLSNLVEELESSIKNDLALKDTFRRLEANSLDQISNEKVFLLTKDELALDTFNSLSDMNHELFDSAKKIEVGYSNTIKWNEISQWYDKYVANFSKEKSIILKEGDSKSGLRGKLNDIGYNVEKTIEKYKFDTTFLTEYLKIAKNEKNFLLSRDKNYLKKAKKESSILLELLKNDKHSEAAKRSLENDINSFITSFSKLVKNYDDSIVVKEQTNLSSGKYLVLLANEISKVDKNSTEKLSRIHSLKEQVYIGIAGSIALTVFLIFLFQRGTSKSIKVIVELSQRLRKTALVTEKSSHSMSSASDKVSSSATEQASAIQETVATLNEITAMVNKSVENAKASNEKAHTSHTVANEGKRAVEEMVGAIGEINGSNEQIMSEMTRSNQEIAQIVVVIKEISEKTKVINDIVFQTKLLSFNASVEAARAGEHGKGFAVVAEEVGNLAQMSGNAAQEIEDLLGGSIKKVQSIVDETQGKVEILISDAKNKIESGVTVANRCGTILDDVVDNVDAVTKMMSEISSASEEQAEGINNITTAMNELDENTHSNSNIAHETSNYANDLSNQTKILNSIVENLDREVLGTNGTSEGSTSAVPSNVDSQFNKPTVAEVPVDNVTQLKTVESNDSSDDFEDDFPSEDDPRFKEVV